MESLSDKLRSLGVHVGVSQLNTRTSPGFDEIIPGEEIINQLGSFYLVEYQYDFNYQHGNSPLAPNGEFGRISNWAHIIKEKQISWEQLAFIDTETSGLAGGAGTLPFLVGIGKFTEFGFRVSQTFLRKGDVEAAALLYLSSLLDDSSIFVSYNGKSFDIPILRNRLVINQLPSEIIQLPHIDLLPLARRLWKLRLESRSLKNIEQEILNFRRTDDEIPGWLVPEIYSDYIHTGEIKGIDGVIYHNRIDIVSLAILFRYINGLLAQSYEGNDIHQIDKYSIARLLDELNEEILASQLYENTLNSTLPDPFKIKILLRNAKIAQRNNNLDDAVKFLTVAYALGDFEASEKLAIIYEGKLKDHATALQYAKRSLELLDLPTNFSFSKRKKLLISVLKRISRIEKKIALGK